MVLTQSPDQPMPYTTGLGAGLGLISETQTLLELWQPGLSAAELYKVAFDSGRLGQMSARRLRNLVVEGFAIRFLQDEGRIASRLKRIRPLVDLRSFQQLLFLYACRAHTVLADFVREIYWPAYAAGREQVSNQEARDFLTRANQAGRTRAPWTEGMVRQVAGYVTGCCADFGLLQPGRRFARRILPFRIDAAASVYLAYDLHFAGQGDNRLIADPDWALFGLGRDDVLDLLKRLALNHWFVVQSAGGVTQISWRFQTMEQVIDAIVE